MLFSFAAELNQIAKIAHVTILPSDDAFGVISFAPDSLSRTVSEGSGSTVSLTVQRTGGVLGPSTVYWQVSGKGAQDVENANGSVVLVTNSNSTQITIRIEEDAVCCFVLFIFLFLLIFCNIAEFGLVHDRVFPCYIDCCPILFPVVVVFFLVFGFRVSFCCCCCIC